MRILRHTGDVPRDLRGGAVAIGNFDGVHRGHAAVITRARDLAKAAGAPALVLTFEPHPRLVFQPDTAPFRLTTLRSKAHHIAALGVDALVVQHFDRAYAGIEAEDFVRNVLVRDLGARQVVVGADFAFGRGRRGNVALLEGMADECGFAVTSIEQVRDGATDSSQGTVIASRAIRTLLADGKPERATELLGRPWEVAGRVMHGDARGRALGFPTANIRLDPDLLAPRTGIYAVRAGIDDGENTRWFDGAASYGTRPQFAGEEARLEVFLLDFSGDLYGRNMRVAFIAYLRDELAFASVDELIAQMNRDVADVRARLAGAASAASQG